MDVIDAELRDIRARPSRLYDALETGKLDLDDLAPRIKELKTRQDELKATSLEEAEKSVLQIVAAYVSKYYPELIDAFGPKGVPAT